MACGKTGPCVGEGELIGTFAPSKVPLEVSPVASFSLVPLTKRLLGWLFSVLQTLGCCCSLSLWHHCPLSGEASWENPRLCLRPATTAALCQGRPSRHRVTTGPALTHISDSPGRTQSPLDVRNLMAGGWGGGG